MNWIKSIHKNEIAITILYGLIALALFWVTCDFNILIGFIGLFLAVMMYITAKQQNQIQKDNIKLQMFDKRYKVFETVIHSADIVNKKDYSDFVLSGNLDPFAINKLVSDINVDLKNQTLLSKSLFDKDIFEIIREISLRFNEVANLHFKLYKQNIRINETDPNRFYQFGQLYAKSLLATAPTDIDSLDAELKKEFPDIYLTIIEFNNAVSNYEKYIKDSRFLANIGKYIIIKDLDK